MMHPKEHNNALVTDSKEKEMDEKLNKEIKIMTISKLKDIQLNKIRKQCMI